jgi:hypothetical protein
VLAVYLVLDGLNTVILPQPGGTAPEWLASWGAASSILLPILTHDDRSSEQATGLEAPITGRPSTVSC